jgi:hypothetical protein
MKNYSDLRGNQGSPILEALNRGANAGVSTFGSVDQFISGLLGQNFIQDKLGDTQKQEDNTIDKSDNKTSQYIRMPKEFTDDEPERGKLDNIENEEDFDEEEETSDEVEQEDNNNYKIYRDKEETFECNISVQGAKLSTSQVRLIFDHEICNVVFYGKVYKDGKCAVPLKKMSFYPEGSIGRVRLEVIVDDTIFVPWEETFVVEGAKKVTVQVKSQKKVDFRF